MNPVKSRSKEFHVLIVDDEPTDIASLNFLAQSLGLHVDLAFDGVEAWKLARAKSYDLIVLDWHMPNLPGWAFLKKLDRALQSGEIRAVTKHVVLHTSDDLALEDFDPQTHFQILDVWHKPLTSIDLLKKMKSAKELLGA